MIALIYFLPLVVMFVAYSVIGFKLWRRTVPGHQTHGANLRHLRAKKKVGVGLGGAGLGAAPAGSGRQGVTEGSLPACPWTGTYLRDTALCKSLRLGLGAGGSPSTLQDLVLGSQQ